MSSPYPRDEPAGDGPPHDEPARSEPTRHEPASTAPAGPAARVRPYVGPRAFQPNERLYGRERETGKLLNLLLAERIVLFYSPSGAGKTSLIQAALIPRLQERHFHVQPVLRVNLEPPQTLAADPKFNRYVFSVISGLEDARPAGEQLGLAELAELSLPAYFERRPKPGPGPGVEALIFDQFEEVLTLDPTDQAAKLEFFNQLGQLLEERTRWALFSMREDYIAALDPFLLPIPTRFNNTLRLDLLDEQAARQAIQLPSRQAGVDFTDEAAFRLCDDLRQVQVQRTDGSMAPQPGPYVEPVQLQVVCYRLWEGLPPGQKQIVAADLGSIGDVDRSLADYYADSVQAIAAATGVKERAIRAWVDTQLISAQGARLQLLMETGRSGGLDNQAIRRLQDAHLIRAEQRRGATWFELSHDRLIKPVRENNAAWFAANLNVVQRQATLWDGEHRPDGLLLRGAELASAELWAADPGRELTPTEQEFMQACRQARRAAERDRQRSQAIAVLGIVAVLAGVVAIVFGIQAGQSVRQANISLTAAQVARDTEQAANVAAVEQRAAAQTQGAAAVTAQAKSVSVQLTADAQRATAQAFQLSAQQAALSAFSHLLATGAQQALTTNADLALLLGIEAYRAQPSDEADQVLHQAIALFSTGGSVEPLSEQNIPRQAGLVFGLSFLGSNDLLAWTTDGTVTTWDLNTRALRVLGPANRQSAGLVFSPDGNALAVAGEGGTVSLLQPNDGSLMGTLAVSDIGTLNSLAYSPDGHWLAVGLQGGTVQIWDMPTLTMTRQLIAGDTSYLTSLAWSPQGDALATNGSRGEIIVWDATSWLPRFHLQLASGAYVWSVAWSPDGAWLASVDDFGNLIVWDAGTGQALAGPIKPSASQQNPDQVTPQPQLTPQFQTTGPPPTNAPSLPDQSLYAVAISPDGRWLAAGGFERSVTIWNVGQPGNPQELTSLSPREGSIKSLVFSPNSSILASGDEAGYVYLWRVVPPLDSNEPVDVAACRLATRNLTAAEWKRYFQSVPYRETCPGK